MIDEYYEKLNKNEIQLGNPLKFNKSIEEYYKFYFDDKDKNIIIKEYLEGLYWLNEYYYNNRLCTDIRKLN